MPYHRTGSKDSRFVFLGGGKSISAESALSFWIGQRASATAPSYKYETAKQQLGVRIAAYEKARV